MTPYVVSYNQSGMICMFAVVSDPFMGQWCNLGMASMERNDALRSVTDTLRALSHEHRLQILGLLAHTERSVGELERLLKLPQPAVSQQLARLRLDHLVDTRRDGRTIYYRTSQERLTVMMIELGNILGYDVAQRSQDAAGDNVDDADTELDGVGQPLMAATA